jgi:tetratricopeptide (TPR) repeat protein
MSPPAFVPDGPGAYSVEAPRGYEKKFALGLQYKRSCRYDEAIREFKAVVDIVPDFSPAHYELGRSCLYMGNNAEAIKAFGRTLRFEPDNMDARFMLRYLPRFAGTLEDELKAAQAHDRLGVVLIMVDNLDCGTQEIQWAVDLAPKNAEYRLNLGYAESFVDEGEAEIEVKEALRLKPKWTDALLLLGAIYMDMRRLSDAMRTYRRAIKIEPDNDVAHYLLGNAYFTAEGLGAARREMEKAVELNPDNYEARRVLVGLYLIDDRIEDAIAQLEELVRMEPGVKSARDKLKLLKEEFGEE